MGYVPPSAYEMFSHNIAIVDKVLWCDWKKTNLFSCYQFKLDRYRLSLCDYVIVVIALRFIIYRSFYVDDNDKDVWNV